MKRYHFITAWILLIIWIFHTLIHTTLLLTQIGIHHTKVARLLKNKKQNLVHISVPSNDKTFIKINEKECIWQQEWYDIQSIEERNGIYYIAAYLDSKEKILIQDLENALEHHQDKNPKSKNYLKFEVKDTYLTVVNFYLIRSSYLISINHSNFFDIGRIYLNLPEPPPEVYQRTA
ncbi:MAG: hypothetical protein NZ455_16765 [Bacteroidia bacterium]|nr:hypothetical protein [Bacteroidia bacterium]MDW8348597.1 hypothetical protein [Bacteroidia bacterium]